jgi:hypothetical protein
VNINTQSVLKAAGIGAGINAIIGVISGASNFLGMDFVTTLVWLFACCGGALIPILTGALYGYFTPGKETMGEAAAGGAISGMVAGLVYGMVNGAITAVVSLVQGISFDIVIGAVGATLFAACCGALIFGSLLGALGGVIWTAVQGDK